MHFGIKPVNPLRKDSARHRHRVARSARLNQIVERYLLLVSQLVEDDAVALHIERPGPYARGWQRRTAELLGVKQPYLSKVLSESIRPGIDEIELAVKNLKISPNYFFASYITEPHYRDFRAFARPPQMGYPALRRFIELADRTGLNLSEQERVLLQRQEWEGEPSEATYLHFLNALRTVTYARETSVRERIARKDGASSKSSS